MRYAMFGLLFIATGNALAADSDLLFNDHGQQVKIMKNPLSKSDSAYKTDIRTCNDFARSAPAEEKIQAFTGCMVRFDNLAQIGDVVLDRTTARGAGLAQTKPSAPYVESRTAAPVSEGHFIAFRCTDTFTVLVDKEAKTVRTITTLGRYRCEETITDGVTGQIATPQSCNVPAVGDFSPMAIIRQSVKVNGNVVRWDGKAVGDAFVAAASQGLNLGQDIDVTTGKMHDMNGNVGFCSRLK